MTELDRLLKRAEDKRARDQRLGRVRDAIYALADDEREELLVEMIAALQKPEPRGPASVPAKPMPTTAGTAATAEVESAGRPSAIREAIIRVMNDGTPRTTGDIADAVRASSPEINVNSVPAAVARMAGSTPPLLIKSGLGHRGAPLYILPSMLIEVSAG